LRRAKVAGAVGPSTVVVANVLREYCTQVSLVEDHHTVGEFGSESAHEPFGETVRPRAPRGNLDYADALIGEGCIERRGELTGSVTEEEPEVSDVIAEIHHQVADLLCGPSAVEVRGGAQQVHGPGADLQHEEDVDPLERHRAVHVEEAAGQHHRCRGAQELLSGRVGVPDRCRRYPQPPQDATDRGRSYAVTELE
jgi:hypothetical protein